jgi:hypothetical protein
MCHEEIGLSFYSDLKDEVIILQIGMLLHANLSDPWDSREEV